MRVWGRQAPEVPAPVSAPAHRGLSQASIGFGLQEGETAGSCDVIQTDCWENA